MTALAVSNNFYAYAAKAGVPVDSLIRFIEAGYYPQPKQMLLHSACRAADDELNANEIGYGGALGGGKTHGFFAQIAIDDSQRFPNLKTLFLRKVGKYAKESLEDLRRSVLHSVKHEFKNNVIHYPNQSRIIIGAYQYEKDIDNYLSLEYDIILIEQAEQISGKKIDLIATRNRSSKGFRPRRYYSFNPGGLAHSYLKTKFIEPFRKENETKTKFIFANFQDNAFLNNEYHETLDTLTGWQKAAWRDGDWDILAGQFFSNFRYETHVVKPFQIPSHWQVWAALDYGFNHPTVCLLFAKNDGIIYVIAEYGERKKLVPSHAEAIKQMFRRNLGDDFMSRLNSFVAGQDAFAQRGNESGKTIADQYKDFGINLTPANTDRISGAGQILGLLGDTENGIPPKMFIFDTCPRLIEQLPMMQHDPNRPEDVLKTDIDDDGNGGDDYYDTNRYGVMTPDAFQVTDRVRNIFAATNL